VAASFERYLLAVTWGGAASASACPRTSGHGRVGIHRRVG
jgi:hypothetical protein